MKRLICIHIKEFNYLYVAMTPEQQDTYDPLTCICVVAMRVKIKMFGSLKQHSDMSMLYACVARAKAGRNPKRRWGCRRRRSPLFSFPLSRHRHRRRSLARALRNHGLPPPPPLKTDTRQRALGRQEKQGVRTSFFILLFSDLILGILFFNKELSECITKRDSRPPCHV